MTRMVTMPTRQPQIALVAMESDSCVCPQTLTYITLCFATGRESTLMTGFSEFQPKEGSVLGCNMLSARSTQPTQHDLLRERTLALSPRSWESGSSSLWVQLRRCHADFACTQRC